MNARPRTMLTSALGLALLGGTLVWAQGPGPQAPSSAGVVPKNRAPVSTAVLQVKLPRPQEADLPNGLHVM
ncbi:MAG: hypothetical protein ACT4QD_25875, partial [Acidobacteriota bacterium]